VSERVLVAGAGAIGSLLAAHLAQVCEVSVLTRRPEHARALNEQGLRVSGRAELLARLTAASDPAELPEPDLVCVCCKGTDLAGLARTLHGHFPAARLMTLQNGLGAEETLAAEGEWPILVAVTFMSGTRHSDTHVEYILDTETWIGPGRATSFADAQAAAELLRSAGLEAKAFPDLRPAQWSKLIFNATVNTVAALTGLPHEPRFAAREQPSDLGWLVHDLIDEGKAVAAAAGVELEEDPWEMNVHATRRGAAHYPSMLEDVEAKRPTELEQITGALLRESERTGVPAPLHRALYRLVKAKEASYS
jgi:2-dehydropantoate 2-reductase